MSNDKNENTSFIIKIVALILMAISAFAGIIISSIILATKGYDIIYLSILVLSIFTGYLLLKTGPKVAEAHSASKIEKIKSGSIQKITEWHIEKAEWSKFIAWKQLDNTARVKSMAIWSTVIAVAVFTYMAYGEFDWLTLAIIVICGALVLGAVMGGMIHLGNKFQLQKISNSEVGQIIFTEKNILMNNLIINFNEMGMKLKYIEATTIDDWELVKVTIETGFGDRTNTHDFNIPIPTGKEQEAEKVIQFYKKLITI
jgi:uncharacterized membrane protein YciS (DUF1049 family)